MNKLPAKWIKLSHHFLLFSFLVFVSGCSISGDNQPRTALVLTVQHHERILSGVDVHIKYFATEFPGYFNDQFDDTHTTDENGQISLRDFPLGNHWYVGIGYDEEFREQVIGNLDLRFDLTNLSHDTILYVSEEH